MADFLAQTFAREHGERSVPCPGKRTPLIQPATAVAERPDRTLCLHEPDTDCGRYGPADHEQAIYAPPLRQVGALCQN